MAGATLGVFVMYGHNLFIFRQINIHLHRIRIALPSQTNCGEGILRRIMGRPTMSNDLHCFSMMHYGCQQI